MLTGGQFRWASCVAAVVVRSGLGTSAVSGSDSCVTEDLSSRTEDALPIVVLLSV